MAGQRRGFVAVSSPDGRGKKGLRPSLQVTIGTAQRCPYCHEHLGSDSSDEALVACAECLTVFHEGCVAEGGGCTTLGCVHARPDLVQAPPAARSASSPRRPGALTAAALAVGLVGLGLGAWAALRPPDVVVIHGPEVLPPPPPPAPLAAPRIEYFDVGLAGDVVQIRAVVEGPTASLQGDHVFAARVNGVAIPLLAVGWRGSHRQVATELPRAQVLGESSTGTLPVELTIQTAAGVVSATRWVQVAPPPPSVIVVDLGPKLRLHADSVQTRDSTVDVRGFVDADGPVTITVRSAAGDVTWQAPAGAFHGTVTVGPRAGTYELVVRVRDRHGLEAHAVQRVEYLGSP